MSKREGRKGRSKSQQSQVQQDPMVAEETSSEVVSAPDASVSLPVTDSEQVSPEQGLGPEYAAVPEHPDPPSYAPILSGLGIAVLAWGFLTDPWIGALGLTFFGCGLLVWIKELTHHEP